ncbi:hypothetical protein C7M84_013815 [Penaeus vannamei]|uniref:Uncharacterized protein n=1 Tax=Penaeus vannamei TaxID=6689 RepID=A0A423SV02_PENVA|nr:hypothetical protein C7M84_013815 [Penaeus vannamei]
MKMNGSSLKTSSFHRSRLTLCTGVLLAALFLVAIYSPAGRHKARNQNSLQTLPNHDGVHNTESISINMWSRCTVYTGILLAVLFLVAIYSTAEATPFPSPSCCPFHSWCCLSSPSPCPPGVDCSQLPNHRCCY